MHSQAHGSKKKKVGSRDAIQKSMAGSEGERGVSSRQSSSREGSHSEPPARERSLKGVDGRGDDDDDDVETKSKGQQAAVDVDFSECFVLYRRRPGEATSSFSSFPILSFPCLPVS